MWIQFLCEEAQDLIQYHAGVGIRDVAQRSIVQFGALPTPGFRRSAAPPGLLTVAVRANDRHASRIATGETSRGKEHTEPSVTTQPKEERFGADVLS